MIVRGPEIALTLPPPPSANAMYLVRGRRRIKSPKYRAWLETVGRELLLQRQGCVGSRGSAQSPCRRDREPIPTTLSNQCSTHL